MTNGKDIEQEVMKEGSKKQRDKFDHTEAIDSIAKCPKCGSNKVNWVFTKRGVSIKCQSCDFDTHFLQDVLSHKKRELEVLPILKQIFPQLVFVENISIDSNILTGKLGSSKTRYDFGVFFFGEKIAKCKVLVCQNIEMEKYFISEEQYVQGRKEVVDYLSKIDAIFIWYFPDDGKKIAMAKCRDIKKFSTTVQDRFHNDQYHIPKEIRKVIIKTDINDFKEMLFKNLYDYITKNVYVI
jgi:hypothetical protein